MQREQKIFIKKKLREMHANATRSVVVKAEQRGLGHDWVVNSQSVSNDTVLGIVAYVDWLENLVNALSNNRKENA